MVRMKKERMGEKTQARLWMGSIIAALVVAITVFVVMIQIEKNILTQYEKGNIYVAIKDIPKGELITAANCDQYFELRQLDKRCIPQTAISGAEQVQNLVASFSIEKGVLLTSGMFEPLNTITTQMKEPVIAGFKAEDLYQVVGGVLRRGDRIHIYSAKEEGETVLVWQNVYVQEVFDNAGKSVPNGDNVTSAQRINIYLDKEDVERFYTELASGALRVVKVVGERETKI